MACHLPLGTWSYQFRNGKVSHCSPLLRVYLLTQHAENKSDSVVCCLFTFCYFNLQVTHKANWERCFFQNYYEPLCHSFCYVYCIFSTEELKEKMLLMHTCIKQIGYWVAIKGLGSVGCFDSCFWKKFMLLFRKDALNWSNVTVKTFMMLWNVYISSKCCSFKNFVHERIGPLKKNSLLKNIKKQLFSALIIRNVYWAPIHYIGRISEGSCDSEDWSNGCWKFSFVITGREKKIIYKMYPNRK